MAHSTPTLDARPTAAASPRARTRYEDDVYGRVQEQVALLRAGRVDALDLDNIAEERNDVGLGEYHRLQSAIEIGLLHMRKWDQQPERRSWALSIAEHRERALMQLELSPGLGSSLETAQRKAFRLGRLGAARQMKRPLRMLPTECPYTWDEILNRPFESDADR